MKFKFIPFLCLALLITSCNNNPPSPSSTITGVVVAGERSLKVGQTTTLVADVLGSDNDLVTWSSDNEDIAIVSNEGEVTALDEGKVTIKATSSEDPTYSADIMIDIYYPNIQGVKIVVDNTPGVNFDQDENEYNLPLGRDIYITYEVTNPQYYKKPTHINFKLTLPSGLPNNNIFTLDYTDDESMRVIRTFDAIENAIITLELGYENTEIPYIYDVATFNVIDINAPKKNELFNDFETLKTYEQNNVNKITISRNKEIVTNNEQVNEATMFNSDIYNNAAYTQIENSTYIDENNNSLSTSYYHHSISNNYYIAFEADSEDNIVELYENKSTHNNDEIKNNVNFAPIFYEGSLLLGVNEVLKSYFISDYSFIADDVVTFSDPSIYAYANFVEEENIKTITSVYNDADTGITYQISLQITYLNDVISSTIFNETIIDGDKTISFQESISLTTGERNDDGEVINPNYIDTNNYYYSSFEVTDYHGSKLNPQGGYIYDYSNDEKYGVDSITSEDGLTKYTLTYDKTLILKIKSPSPSTANSLIDKIVAVSSDENQIKSVETVGEDLFAINPIANSDGLAQTGKATFTFTSRKGTTHQIIVEFIAKDLQGIVVSNIPNLDMGEIYQNKYTPYFYLNAIPDEDKYEFGINILSGPTNGITLNRWAYDNEFGYPGFSYYIEGISIGEYTFKFFASEEGAIVQSEDTYTLKVIPPKTVDEIKEIIIGETYRYATTNNTHVATICFDTDTTFTLTSEMIGSEKVSTTITYHIETGKVIIDDTTNNTLGAGFYWSKINPGEIIFDNTYTNMSIKFTDSASGGDTTLGSYYVHFNKVISGGDIEDFENYINGNTYTKNDTQFISSLGQSNISVSFDNGKGTLTLTPVNTSTASVIYTFDYVYVNENNTCELSLSNIEVNNELFTMNSSSSVDLENGTITFVIFSNSIRYAISIKII